MPELFTAVVIPDGALWGGLVAVLTTIGGGLKVIWAYWTKREADRVARYKDIIDGKEKTVSEKDEEITRLGKELSKKSDAHAEKVEQLMNLTLTKVEEMGDKHLAMGEKALGVMADFTATVNKLNLEGQ